MRETRAKKPIARGLNKAGAKVPIASGLSKPKIGEMSGETERAKN